MFPSNKKKIINDPVYGFISLPGGIIYDLIEHPWFQRLRNIRQLGMAYYVYPGAVHTRFQHSLGALHLTKLAIDTLRNKGVVIMPEEEESTYIAILLHDLGHGPFSHSMEEVVVNGVKHEDLGFLLMSLLNEQFNGKLTMAIDIFTNNYFRKFFHELVSGQIDMDRLDYLRRDSFFTGVIEGSVGSDRIINMLNVVDDTLVIEEKGIYSIEKFLIARRLMYWQVYMHKTVIAAENILTSMFNRAKELTFRSVNLFSTPQLAYFMERDFSLVDIQLADKDLREEIANNFVALDDSDILVAAKYWSVHNDKILSDLSSRLLKRKLFAIELQNIPFEEDKVDAIENMIMNTQGIDMSDIDYYITKGKVYNRVYSPEVPDIKILAKNGEVNSILTVSDMFDIDTMRLKKTKNFLCYPKECRLN
jgi:HD superfamily phosphohydrolase